VVEAHLGAIFRKPRIRGERPQPSSRGLGPSAKPRIPSPPPSVAPSLGCLRPNPLALRAAKARSLWAGRGRSPRPARGPFPLRAHHRDFPQPGRRRALRVKSSPRSPIVEVASPSLRPEYSAPLYRPTAAAPKPHRRNRRNAPAPARRSPAAMTARNPKHRGRSGGVCASRSAHSGKKHSNLRPRGEAPRSLPRVGGGAGSRQGRVRPLAATRWVAGSARRPSTANCPPYSGTIPRPVGRQRKNLDGPPR